MAKKPQVKVNIDRMREIQSSLKKVVDGHYSIQVGIFGDKDSRRGAAAGVTNTEIGFIHEMGSHARGIPRRSFLWDTFSHHGDKLMATTKPLVEKLFKKGKIDEYLNQTGIAATNLVIEAFMTSGWGSWAPNKYRTLLSKLKGSLKKRKAAIAKGTNKPLIDSGQLWQSVAHRVVKHA